MPSFVGVSKHGAAPALLVSSEDTDTSAALRRVVNDPRVCRYTRENHNSVLGVREYALQHGARFQAVEADWVEDWISGHKESVEFVHPRNGTADEPTMSLFAFPAEENFSGGLYPLRWIREIQVRQCANCFWCCSSCFCYFVAA